MKEGLFMKKIKIPGELALFIAVIINSLGIALMTKSNFGISSNILQFLMFLVRLFLF